MARLSYHSRCAEWSVRRERVSLSTNESERYDFGRTTSFVPPDLNVAFFVGIEVSLS